MAQPNVAREPSMEEILASIRRIIESNEPPLGPPPVLAPTADAEAASNEDRFDDETIVADFHAEEARRTAATSEIEVVPASAVQPEPRAAQPAMSLADVAARELGRIVRAIVIFAITNRPTAGMNEHSRCRRDEARARRRHRRSGDRRGRSRIGGGSALASRQPMSS